jgi:hypothetical protein
MNLRKNLNLLCMIGFAWSQTILASSAAQAHGSNPAGLTPFLVDGEMVGAATNLGLVLNVDGIPTWRTEIRVHGELHWFGYTSTGRVILGTSNTLLVTEDGGCTFEGHSEVFGEQDVRAMALSPDTSRPHFLATATESTTNSIYRTSDGGDTWEAIAETTVSGQYLGLRYARVSGDYLAMSTGDVPGEYVFTVVGALGDVTATHTLPVEEAEIVRLISPGAEPGTAFVAAFSRDYDAEPVPLGTALPGTDNLYFVDLNAGTLSLIDTLTESNRFFSGAVFDGEAYLTDFNDRYLRFTPEGLVQIGEEVRYCIDDSLSLDTFWACGRRPQDHTFYTTQDGENWTGLLAFDDIEVALCPDKEPTDPGCPGDGVDLSDGGTEPGDSCGTSNGSGDGEDISKGDLPDASDSGAAVPDPEKPLTEGGCSATPMSLAWILGFVAILRRRR